MSVLTTSQLTFCDLKDSYSLYIDTECIAVPCDNTGLVLGNHTITIHFRILAGSNRVKSFLPEVSDLPDGVSIGARGATLSTVDGSIEVKITNGATLNNAITSSMKIIVTTNDSEQFVFEKYITFVKSIAGYDGTDAVNFQIYSVDGFEFNDGLTSIELKTIAFQGGNIIESGATYQWKWWNNESTLDDKYENISGATSSTFIVNVSDQYAFTSLKCEMTYDEMVYEDYISLTQERPVYTAIAKFFDNNNVIASDEDYTIVYIELYKDNNPEELLYTDSIHIGTNSISTDNTITTDIEGSYEDGDLKYFACETVYNDITEYDVILGRYDSSSGVWNIVQSNYIYKNDLFANTLSPIVFVPKNKIARSLNINFEIYDEDGSAVARTTAMILDLNDPTISSTEPTNPKDGQMWLDTSVSPNVLKMWDGESWVTSGAVIYTSQPTNGYSKGDLWILSKEDAELFPDIGEGTMLKATITSSTFDISHWEDVDKEGTEQKQNIRQYFLFNADTGLRIGQADNKFYVNISSTEMGFYDASDGTSNKVVSISNQSATIKNTTLDGNTTLKSDATIEGNTNFYGQINICDPSADSEDSIDDALFIWKIESNGSLSLALAT